MCFSVELWRVSLQKYQNEACSLWTVETLPALFLAGRARYHYWAMSRRFVLHHILIKQNGLVLQAHRTNDWTACYSEYVLWTQLVSCLWAQQQAGLVAVDDPLPLLLRELQVGNCRLQAEVGAVTVFSISYSCYVAGHLHWFWSAAEHLHVFKYVTQNEWHIPKLNSVLVVGKGTNLSG